MKLTRKNPVERQNENNTTGATALEISEIGFGGIPIIPLPREEAVAIVKHCIESDPAHHLFPLATQTKMGIIGMKPLGGGVLERADLCFRFLQQHPYVVPIPGLRAKKEADEIVERYRPAQGKPGAIYSVYALMTEARAKEGKQDRL